jgi:flagellar basal-body rod modification protein FlgD
MSQVQQTNQTIPQQVLPGQTERKPSAEMGKDQFLALLVSQLQHQDPMEPTADKEFIGQMAQFSALEQTTNVATAMSELAFSTQLSQGVGLMGKTVTYVDADEAQHTGVVSGVQVVDGKVVVSVGDEQISTKDIRSVS